MKKILAATALVALSSPALAEGFTEAWRTSTGFAAPESAIYDAATGAIYVTNVNSGVEGASGYVSKLGLDGSVLSEKFAEGLSQPKGTAIKDGKLYTAGTNQIGEIDLATGAVSIYAIENAPILNDIAVGPDGALYITETISGAIYRFDEGKAEVWLQDPAIGGINGITTDGERFVVVRFGDLSGGFENIKPGDAKQIDFATKTISAFGPQGEIGLLDGVHLQDGVAYVTNNFLGTLLAIPEEGEISVAATLVSEIGEAGAGAADQAWIAEEGLVVVPLMMQNSVVAFKAN